MNVWRACFWSITPTRFFIFLYVSFFNLYMTHIYIYIYMYTHINRLVSYFSVCFLKRHLKPDLYKYYICILLGWHCCIHPNNTPSWICFVQAIRILHPQSIRVHILCAKFQDPPRVFFMFFWSSQVEDETTLNEVPCDLSRFHAQLRDHSPLGSWNVGWRRSQKDLRDLFRFFFAQLEWCNSHWSYWNLRLERKSGEHDLRWWISMDIGYPMFKPKLSF